MTFKMKYNIESKYLPKNTKRRSGILMPYVGFIVAHDTGNDGSTALNNINHYINSANTISASAHVFIDDKRIIECIPATTGKPEKAWHVLYDRPEDNKLFGDDANDIAIGVELCYSHNKGNINNKEAYKRYVWYIAYLCYKFNLDPMTKIVGHDELDPGRKLDPFKNALKIMGISKAQFLADVAAELKECTSTDIKEESEDDAPMKLADWERNLLIEGINKYSKINGTDGLPVINRPDLWIAKIKNDEITAGEIAILNFAILSRTVK